MIDNPLNKIEPKKIINSNYEEDSSGVVTCGVCCCCYYIYMFLLQMGNS